MKTRNDFTPEQVQAIVNYCQPEYCSWVGEWMTENNETQINEFNVFQYIYDEFGNPETFIKEILEDLVD